MRVRRRALAFLGALGVGYALAVTAWPLRLPTLCLFRRMTGRPCPTCGMTHACCALAHGDVWQAVRFHVAVVPLAMIVVAAAGLLLIELVTDRPMVGRAWGRTWRGVIAVLMVAVMVGWVLNLRSGG